MEWETKFGFPGQPVAGVDEVGRGCLAGPVVAAAVILPEVIDFGRDSWLAGVSDSKLLTHEKRQRLAPLIAAWVRCSAVGCASVEEIDRINILHASHLAMVRAIESMGLKAAHALVDGNFTLKKLFCPSTAIVKGDQKCLSIACASIIAKVWRDNHMAELDVRYPGYGFAVHKGYPTPAHTDALRRIGPCEIHRRSFRPVAELCGASHARAGGHAD